LTTSQYGGRLSALGTDRLYPQEYSWYSFYKKVNDVEFRENYQFEIPNSSKLWKDIDVRGNIERAWQNVRENKKNLS
jgi:hypothetical protein